jgi:hypothetical protein
MLRRYWMKKESQSRASCAQSSAHFQSVLIRRKTLYIKNQGWEPIHGKYKANDSMSRHNPKKKQKQTTNKK